MKIKHITAVLILSALFLSICMSCQPSGADSESSIDFDLAGVYIIGKFVSGDNGIYKYNLITGTTTHLCMDPLCNHEPHSECRFSGVMDVVIDGQWIYYIKDDELRFSLDRGDKGLERIQSICAFNYVTHEFNVLYTNVNKDGYDIFRESLAGSFNGYVYFSLPVLYSDGKEGRISYRVDVTTKEIEKMYENEQIHFNKTTDYLFYYDYEQGIIFRADHWLSNITPMLRTTDNILHYNDEYIYFTSLMEKDISENPDLYRMCIHTFEKELILRDLFAATIRIIEDYVYYIVPFQYDEIGSVFIDSNGMERRKNFIGEIWRAKIGSGEHEMIYCDENLNIDFIQAVGQYLVVTYKEEREVLEPVFGSVGKFVPAMRFDIADYRLVYDTIAEKWLEYK